MSRRFTLCQKCQSVDSVKLKLSHHMNVQKTEFNGKPIERLRTTKNSTMFLISVIPALTASADKELSAAQEGNDHNVGFHMQTHSNPHNSH